MQELLFQFHVTTSALLEAQKDTYLSICHKCNVKPVFIQLPKGQHMQQPMFTALIEGKSFSVAYEKVAEILKEFSSFPPVRIKAEVDPINDYLFTNITTSKWQPYYEWHCNIKFINPIITKSLAQTHRAHLSENSLEADAKFLTIRDYGSKELFLERTANLSNALQENHIPIIKEKFEYCIYDNKLELDKGWAE